MLNFFDELYKHIGMEYGTGFRLFFIGGKAIYIEGYTELKEFSDSVIEFKFKNESIKIEGEALVLKSFEKDCSVINGNILKIEREGIVKKNKERNNEK